MVNMCLPCLLTFEGLLTPLTISCCGKNCFWIGISGKIIRLIKCLYDGANFFIEMDYKRTSDIEINTGVLLGESLSSLLLNIFINDMEKSFRDHNMIGLSIDHLHDILLLIMYADDTVIFGYSPADIQNHLNM